MPVPPGFSRLQSSPFSDLVGPLYRCDEGDLPAVGLVIQPEHANTMGFAHGGLLATLADVALGQALKAVLPKGLTAVTANLNITFLGSAAVGEWVEAWPAIDKRGTRLIFLTCELRSPGGPVAKVSATFAVSG
jgi:acyl-coenzyme A thioesterase 13